MSGSNEKTQALELFYDGGIDQRQHPKQMQGPSVLAAVNGRWENSGGFRKRFGHTLVASGFRGGYQLVPGYAKAIGFRDELLITDSYRIGSMSTGGSPASRWFQDRGKVPECVSRMRAVDTASYQVIGPDSVYSNGYVFHAYITGAPVNFNSESNIFTTVEDVETGTLIQASYPLAMGIYYTPHLVAANGAVILVYRDSVFSAGTNTYYHIWNWTTMSWGAQTLFVTNVGSDIAVCSDGTSVYMLFRNSVANDLRVRKYNSAMTQLASIICSEPASAALALGFGICATAGEKVWISFNLTGATSFVKVANFDINLAAETLAPTVVKTTAGTFIYSSNPVRLTSTSALISLGSSQVSHFPVITNAGVISATATNRTAHWVCVASKPFVASSAPLRCYAWAYVGGANLDVSDDPNNSYTFMLIDLGADDTATVPWAPRPITWQAPRYSAIDGVVGSIAFWAPPSPAMVNPTRWDTNFVTRRNARTRTGMASASADFSDTDRFASCELGQTLFLTPGFFYDKDRFAEIGFSYYPQGLVVTVSAVGGTYGATTRTYIAMYEYVDANGFIHRSVPSPAFGATAAAGAGTNSFVIEVPCLTVTAKQTAMTAADMNAVRIVIYVLNVGTGLYERVFPEGSEALNDPKVRSITITDTGLNTAASGVPREILYTESGVFPNVMPNGFTACCTYRNRVWIAYGHTVMYSKAFVTGETVNFTDAFELPLEESGDITAMWKMDDTLYISTDRAIYYLQADGPNDFGQQNDIGTPNQIATDRGVSDQRSVAVTPIGTLYQSTVGIQLLDRGRTVPQEPIGSRVQGDLAAFPEIVGTNVHPTGRYVTFACENSAGDAGIRLVYDYALNRWSRDTLYTSSITSGVRVLSETISRGVLYAALDQVSGTEVVFEDITHHLDGFQDAGGWVPLAVDLAEFHPAGLQARIGVRNWQFFNDRHTDHNLSFDWWKNYESTAFASKSLNSDTQGVLRGQASFDVAVQQVQSIRVRIKDAPPLGAGAVIGTGKGATFVGLTVDVENFGKTYRLSAAQKS